MENGPRPRRFRSSPRGGEFASIAAFVIALVVFLGVAALVFAGLGAALSGGLPF